MLRANPFSGGGPDLPEIVLDVPAGVWIGVIVLFAASVIPRWED